ncbi:MAG: filamentous hemagglutinin N-terminal domain-containing protein [Hydrococcus sp. SU_1_0]|nr:filamentous hemagglutinin N-terminal domain-containing protein [Hydrococcus sp. SU_1_0]
MQRAFTSIFFSTLSLVVLSCLIPLTAKAQVTPDGTTSTTVNQDGDNFTIEQGDRVGDNLFHSFNEFSVPTSGSAAFNNAGDIANIFSRVTGSSISSIDGLISANGAANLFLINPNGIIFGENASLNLGGSFFASTADSLLFEGDAEFSAVNPQAPPLLEVSIPIGASFRDNPGDIVNQSIFSVDGGLIVRPGKTLALIGGNITFQSGQVFCFRRKY